MLATAFLGSLLRGRIKPFTTAGHQDIDIILGAPVTLLALIIGFSLSMAVTRYHQRMNYEEAEANAIDTAFFCAPTCCPTLTLHTCATC